MLMLGINTRRELARSKAENGAESVCEFDRLTVQGLRARTLLSHEYFRDIF